MIKSAVAKAIAIISTVQAVSTNGVIAEHLSNILWMLQEDADNTIADTSQMNRQDGNTSLLRNFIINDFMLRYRRLNSIYFTETLFYYESEEYTW